MIEVRREITHDQIKLAVHLPKKTGWFSRQQVQGSVEIVVTAPATVDLADIRTVNGTVAISGFSHGVKASSVNGTIEARDLQGSAELDTVNGTIRATLLKLDPSDRLTCSSVNGGIDLRFAEPLDADLNASVVNGRIHCDFPITLAEEASSRRLQGRIGDGGAALRATTVNGTIRLRQN